VVGYLGLYQVVGQQGFVEVVGSQRILVVGQKRIGQVVDYWVQMLERMLKLVGHSEQ
jgi:hypothetical protein